MRLRRRRVMFLTPWYPTRDNPASGVFVREHARAAAVHSDVLVVHLQWARGLVPEIRADDVADEPVPTLRIRYTGPWRARHPLQIAALALAFGAVQSRRFRPDVLHANVASMSFPGAVAALVTRVPLVVTEHWSLFLDDDPACFSKGAAVAVRWALRRAAMVLPVSSRLGAAIEVFAPGVRCRTVPNVVDTAVFHPGDARASIQPVRLLAVGLLSPEKDYDTMLDAARSLARAQFPFTLDVVGYGEEAERLQAKSENLGLAGVVRLRGYLPKEEIGHLMRSSDIFVHASRYETFGASVAEALSSGMPVVVTRCGGPEDFVTPNCGVLVAVGDAERMADAIRDVASRIGTFAPHFIAGEARDRFSLDAVASLLEEVYASVEPHERGRR